MPMLEVLEVVWLEEMLKMRSLGTMTETWRE